MFGSIFQSADCTGVSFCFTNLRHVDTVSMTKPYLFYNKPIISPCEWFYKCEFLRVKSQDFETAKQIDHKLKIFQSIVLFDALLLL